ncbi:RsmD family RNA methyltransferase [Bifidobacterium biavatii]|uniref:DNA methyltransferase n=1 Tax=Bifidobacterium biavatii DSM 23969 TaxID=1437608 RepID=A0A086ZTQ1_9BIFI|nr:RsmD family RNA methyltransferase [Bifidobacterium biavatii]KFI49901.1 DNA methyltransferase [Bifidobacterium biavatii DSM 23969]
MRVISGRFKGVALTTPKSVTRPTTDRTKEAIFSRLDSWGVLDDARVLDLFAGTGALGIEALSRGARELVAVEANGPAAALIAKTLTALKRNRSWETGMSARVIKAKAEKYAAPAAGGLRAAGVAGASGVVGASGAMDRSAGAAGISAAAQPFDVIFIDPPYAFETSACESLLADLTASGMAGEQTLIVLERSARSDEPAMPAGWVITERRDYGETAVFYVERESAVEEEDAPSDMPGAR